MFGLDAALLIADADPAANAKTKVIADVRIILARKL